MKLGCCASLEMLEAVARAGFEFIEPETADLIPRQSDADFRSVRRLVEATPIKPEVFRGFIPEYRQLIGEDIDFQQVRRHVLVVLERAAAVGGKIVVFDSGQVRAIPEGFPPERAFNQLIGFLRMADEYARRFNLLLAIEPMNHRECQLINTFFEALELMEEVDRPRVKVMADIFHMAEEEESWNVLKRAGENLLHVHVADTGRRAPGTGIYDWGRLFEILHTMCYNGRISVECDWQDFEREGPEAVDFLRRMF